MYDFFNLEHPKAMECLTNGICAIDPRTIALSETFIYETRQLTYYILKIKEIGYENLSIVDSIITTLASINFGFEYQTKDIEKLLSDLHEKRTEVIDFYKNLCRKKNLDCQLLQSLQPSDEDINIIKAIMTGERQSIKKNTQISTCKKNLYEIMILIAKSTASTLTKLADYNIDCISERYKLLEFFNSLNFLNIREEKLTKKILNFSQVNHELNLLLDKTYEENYSTPTTTLITLDIEKGKCILISGDNYNDLDLLLKETEGTGINIYTHDMMLLTQQYPYFKRFSHLVGQYQHKNYDFQMDFSTFPGPILLTKNYSNKIESIYRGNLFSTDVIAGKGLTQIKNYNFAPLIKAANDMTGFLSSEKKINIKIGYNTEEINNNIDTIIKKINMNQYKDIYIVGLINYGYHSNEFFERLYEKIGDDNFIISLTYNKKAENILHIKSYYDFSLIYKIIEKLQQNIDTQRNKIKIILTQCTNTSLTNFFILRKLGIEDIYITCCNMNNLNPSVLQCLREHFNIKQLTDNPKEEIEL